MERKDEYFERLWTDYLEGELDEAGIDELQQLLTERDDCARRVSDLYRVHRLVGFLAKDNEVASKEFVRETMKRLPKTSEVFTEDVVRRQREIVSRKRAAEASCTFDRGISWGRWGAVAATIALVATGWLWNRFSAADQGEPKLELAVESGEVQVTSLAQAKFFGELSPELNSTVPLGKEFILIEGMMELRFPQGAEVILEAPAVFHTKEKDLLVVDMGVCSVHAPPGAEGFRLVTPGSTIVDRGTRFSVKVDENNKTEVQMIEGLADVYPMATDGEEPENSRMIRLSEKQALLMNNLLEPETSEVPFDLKLYRKRLPDRIVSFEASRSSEGFAEDLTSVKVQRGGEETSYPVDEIIKADVTWFKAAEDNLSGYLLTAPGDGIFAGEDAEEALCVTRYDYLMTAPGASSPPWALLADHSLLTGTINPGGSSSPLTTDPVIVRDISKGIEGTPGMAIRFHQPVTNGPGPDVVFFELQPVIYPDGDSFHVSPLHFKKGLRSHRIRNYDLNLHSSEALRVTQPHVHFSKDQVAKSLEELSLMELQTRPTKLIYRAVAVGIDLSDLGYAPGEQVNGLFFQDDEEDQFHIDPVFIGGLPSR